MSPASPQTLVVIPTYNERINLPLITHRIMRETTVAMLIVDDNSPDGTGSIADELASDYPQRVFVLHRDGPRGLGRAYVAGMRQAIALGAQRICQMDADLSHGPEYLPALLAAANDADVVVGSRYVTGGSVVNWPRRRRLLSMAANTYVRIVTGLPVRDATSGFKCWRREALMQVLEQPLRSHGYALQFEMLFHARRFRQRIVELPIEFVERREGASKMSGRVIREAALRPLALVFSPPGAMPARVAQHVAADLREFAGDLQGGPRPTKPAEPPA